MAFCSFLSSDTAMMTRMFPPMVGMMTSRMSSEAQRRGKGSSPSPLSTREAMKSKGSEVFGDMAQGKRLGLAGRAVSGRGKGGTLLWRSPQALPACSQDSLRTRRGWGPGAGGRRAVATTGHKLFPLFPISCITPPSFGKESRSTQPSQESD